MRSLKTVMFYLNDEYDNGATLFGDYNESQAACHMTPHDIHTVFKGQTGDCIIFDHKLWHEGQQVTQGNKYLLKSELMFELSVEEGELSAEALATRLYYAGTELEKSGDVDSAIKKYRAAYKLFPLLERQLF